MGFTVGQNTVIYIKEEVTEGTHVAPASGSDAILPLADGVELTPSRELIDRNVLNGSIGKNTSRKGMKSVSGNISVEFKAQGTEGQAPEYGLLIESALGNVRTGATQTSTTGNTSSVIEFGAAPNFAVGDIVMIKEAGSYHISPVSSVDVDSITLLRAASGAFSDGVVVAAVSTYYPANSGHKAISVTKYVEDSIEEKGTGCKITSMALSNFSVGQIAQLDFGMEGLTYARSVNASGLSESFDSSKPPIVLEACVFVDGVQTPVSELGFSIENTLGFIMDTCSANGKTASRITERSITGNFNPYKQDDSIANFTKFDEGTAFSLFGYAVIPTGTAGEYQDVVAFYLPSCQVTELSESDQDGVLQDAITFQATRGDSGSSEEIYISFI